MNPDGKLGLLTYHHLLRCKETYSTYDLFDVKGVSDLETCMDYFEHPERSCENLSSYAQMYLQPHYGNGIFGNVYLSAGQH